MGQHPPPAVGRQGFDQVPGDQQPRRAEAPDHRRADPVDHLDAGGPHPQRPPGLGQHVDEPARGLAAGPEPPAEGDDPAELDRRQGDAADEPTIPRPAGDRVDDPRCVRQRRAPNLDDRGVQEGLVEVTADRGHLLRPGDRVGLDLRGRGDDRGDGPGRGERRPLGPTDDRRRHHLHQHDEPEQVPGRRAESPPPARPEGGQGHHGRHHRGLDEPTQHGPASHRDVHGSMRRLSRPRARRPRSRRASVGTGRCLHARTCAPAAPARAAAGPARRRRVDRPGRRAGGRAAPAGSSRR